MLLASAAILSLCMPGFGISLPVWVGFSLFLVLLKGCSPWKGFLKGLCFGLVYFGICLHWIIPTFYNEIPNMFERFPSEIGIVVYLLLCLIEAAFFGLFGLVYCAFQDRVKKRLWLYLLFVPSLLVLTELLRGWGPMGFTGYRFSDSLYRDFGILQIAGIGGNELLLWLIAFSNAWISFYWQKPLQFFKKKALSTALIIIGAVYLLNALVIVFLPPVIPHMQTRTRIAVMQPWVEPREKYSFSEQEFVKSFENSIMELIESGQTVDVIVFPEAYFLYDIQRSPLTLRSVETMSKKIGTPIVLPHPRIDNDQYFNAVRVVDPVYGLGSEFYGKMKLTPFVETLPFGEFFKVFEFLMLFAYFQEGPQATVFELSGRKFGFPICFESLYPEVFEAFHRNGAEILAVVTNDGWFGNQIGLETHFAFLPFRAVESRRWMLQVSNNGVTGLVDPYGRIIQRLPSFEDLWDVFEVPSGDFEENPYIAFRRIWLTIFLFAFVFACLFGFVVK